MSEYQLTAAPRPSTGKGPARRARAAGHVPAVLYGQSADPRHLSIDAREFGFALRTDAGTNVLLQLDIDGDRQLAVAKEIQRDPLRGTFIHVDLLAVDRNDAIEVDVPVHLVGTAPGVRLGGRLEQELHDLLVLAQVSEVPQSIDVDVSSMGPGAVLLVRDLDLPDGITVTTPGSVTVATIVSKTVSEAETTEATPETE